jgi:hypothetical protein
MDEYDRGDRVTAVDYCDGMTGTVVSRSRGLSTDFAVVEFDEWPGSRYRVGFANLRAA